MISFTSLLTDTTIIINEANYKKWLKSVIISEGKSTGDLQYIYCDDRQLHDINLAYLNHDTYTDIITFSASDNKDIISGEIYISYDRVMENSKSHLVSFNEELSRVMVHGILHLIGYNDHTPAQKSLMRSKEDYYLHLQP